MNTRNSYNYAKPTTLVLIISDALDHINQHTKHLSRTVMEVRGIVADALDALETNAGTEDAFEMLLQAGIGPAELSKAWPSGFGTVKE